MEIGYNNIKRRLKDTAVSRIGQTKPRVLFVGNAFGIAVQ